MYRKAAVLQKNDTPCAMVESKFDTQGGSPLCCPAYRTCFEDNKSHRDEQNGKQIYIRRFLCRTQTPNLLFCASPSGMSVKRKKDRFRRNSPLRSNCDERSARHSDSTGDLTGAKATGASIYTLGGSVNDCLHTLDVGLPGTIGAAVGVGNLNTKCNALSAKFALCHDSAPPYDCDLCPVVSHSQ